jgi:hypothetical protein
VKSTHIRNPQRPDTADEMRSIDCRSHRIALYVSHAVEPPRELPMELVIDQFHPRLDARIAVGATAASVRAGLGAPSSTRGGSFGYAIGKRDTLTFEVWSGRIRAVTWSWDVD